MQCRFVSDFHDSLLAIGWNVCGVGTNDRSDFLDEVTFQFRWGVLMLQEWGIHPTVDEIDVCGHRAFHGQSCSPHDRTVAIIVNQNFEHFASFGACEGKALAVKLCLPERTFWCVTCHLPHSDHGEQAFIDALNDFKWVCRRRPKDVCTIVSVDGNCIVGAQVSSREFVLGDFGHGSRDDRGALLLKAAIELKLIFVESTFLDNLGKGARTTWDGSFDVRIDYLLMSDSQLCSQCQQVVSTATSTDHKSWVARVRSKHQRKRRPRMMSKPIGWAPLDAELFRDESRMRTRDAHAFEDWECGVGQTARKWESFTVSKRKSKWIDRAPLRALEAQLRATSDDLVRLNLVRAIGKLRRELKLAKVHEEVKAQIVNPCVGGWGKKQRNSAQSQGGSIRITDEQGHRIYDRFVLKQGLTNHFSVQFTAVPDRPPLPDWIHHPHLPGPHVTRSVLSAAIASCKLRKSCADDCVVAEMFMALDGCGYGKISGHEAFKPCVHQASGPGSYGLDWWCAQIDGSSLGNPGPAGCGVALFDASGQLVWYGAIGLSECTSNVAEYHSLLVVIQVILALGVPRVVIECDSKLVVEQCLGNWACRDPLLQNLLHDVLRICRHATELRIRHISRRLNAFADGLAKHAATGKGRPYVDLIDVIGSHGHGCHVCGCERDPSCCPSSGNFPDMSDVPFDIINPDPTDSLDDFAHIINDKLDGITSHYDLNVVQVRLLKKILLVTKFKHLRPIALIPVPRNLAAYAVFLLVKDSFVNGDEWQFAFKPGYQTLELISVVRLVIEKCLEWDIPLWVLGVDIPKAYDETALDMILECCSRRDVPPNVAAYLLKDLMSCLLEFNMDSVKSNSVSLFRALLQGGKHSPMVFIEVLSDILSPIWAYAQNWELGVCIDGLYVPFVVFADNIWVLATQRDHMELLYFHIRVALQRGGFRLPLDRGEWMCTVADYVPFEVNGQVAVRKESIIMLGSMVSPSTSHFDDVRRRCFATRSNIDSMHVYWSCPGTSRHQRASLMERANQSMILYGAQCWRLPRQGQQKLRAAQLYGWQRAMRMPRYWGEPKDSYFHRLNSAIAQLQQEMKVKKWDEVALSRLHSWAGHVVRLADREPKRLVGRCLRWNGMLELRTRSVAYGSQGRVGRFAVVRWESQLYDYYMGVLHKWWWDVAVDAVAWRDSYAGWLASRLARMEADHEV